MRLPRQRNAPKPTSGRTGDVPRWLPRLALQAHSRAPCRTRNWQGSKVFAAGTNPSAPAWMGMDHAEKQNSEPAQEQPHDEARKIVEEYANSLREFIRKLRRHFN